MLLFLLLLLLSGCGLISTGKELPLITPPLPEHWRAFATRLRYRVSWIAADGRGHTVTCAPGETVPVELPRLANSAVLVTPVLQTSAGERPLRPGAALYPQDLIRHKRLIASWKRGFEGKLFLELQRRGYAYFQVNQPRLRGALEAECGADPWQADFNRVLTKILQGSFRSSYLRPREAQSGMEELPSGRYLRDNMLLEPVETIEIEGRSLLVLEGLYPGSHRLFRESGGELLVTNDGEHPLEWSFF
jgi:hypothetical protein